MSRFNTLIYGNDSSQNFQKTLTKMDILSKNSRWSITREHRMRWRGHVLIINFGRIPEKPQYSTPSLEESLEDMTPLGAVMQRKIYNSSNRKKVMNLNELTSGLESVPILVFLQDVREIFQNSCEVLVYNALLLHMLAKL